MTVTSKQHLVSYEYSGADPSKTVFPIPFFFRQNSEISVYSLLFPASPPFWPLVRTPLGAQDYRIDFGAGLHSGGQITLLSGPQTSETGEFLVIERVIPITQLYDLTNVGNVYPETVEYALDTIVMMIQQLEYILSSTNPLMSRVMQLMPGVDPAAPAYFNANFNILSYVADPLDPMDAVNQRSMFSVTDALASLVKKGLGSPNGSLVGDIGDIYCDLNGSTNTTLYVKTADNGQNTGWTAK